jgi:glycosyltransferase involved in cell wall biosynthesis
MRVSVCIPTYEMKGKGSLFLGRLFHSLAMQTFQDFEVVVADHSTDDEIQNLCKSWESDLRIKYVSNNYKRGKISANLNVAISSSSGEIIDFMMQDDYYADVYSLQKRVDNLGERDWALSSTMHFNGSQYWWHLVPSWRDDIYLGFNSIGSPALLTVKNSEKLPKFDEELFLLTDCDYFKQLYLLFGEPKIIADVTVISYMWEGNSQKDVSEEKKNEEIKIVKAKYE